VGFIQIIGRAAVTLTTGAFFPQAIKTWRKGSAEDVSLLTFGALCGGVTLWMAYGLLIGALAIILTNGITLPAALSIYGLALCYRWRDAQKEKKAAREGA
jgi:MtN3 and saliva related transmembrane protein